MTTILRINGLSCGHFVLRVAEALNAIPGVERAEVDLKSRSAPVKYDVRLKTDLLLNAVAEEGYSAEVE